MDQLVEEGLTVGRTGTGVPATLAQGADERLLKGKSLLPVLLVPLDLEIPTRWSILPGMNLMVFKEDGKTHPRHEEKEEGLSRPE